MRRSLIVALGAAWLAAVSSFSPFAHVHAGDPGHRHDNGFAHMHGPHGAHHDADGEGLELEADDHEEDAVWTEWAPTAAPRFEVAAAGFTSIPILDLVYVAAGYAPEYIPRAHGPPSLRLLPARSPPV